MSRVAILSCLAKSVTGNSLLNILILGGTHFVGWHIAEALATAGHSVSVLNRGKSPDELPAQIERLRGDRDQGKESWSVSYKKLFQNRRISTKDCKASGRGMSLDSVD
ncbi:MAG: hypothetical protein KDA84_08020 [Planctomycetaceae bacterium]|nr:hypothetical protein [Planctomycetaceae bacterium]